MTSPSVVDMDAARRRRDLARDFTALKLAALDCAMVDPRLTHLDFRMYYYLSSAADRQTQTARRKQQVIANALRVSRRAVQISAERISEFGYIKILTKDGGSYTNGYEIVLQNANEGSPSENIKANPVSSFAKKRRTRSAKKANENGENGEPPFAPIFPFNSLEIPKRPRGPSSTDVLGPVGERIRRAIGDAAYRSWFGSVALLSIADGIVTISAPRPYQRTRIAQDFEIAMLKAWQADDPTIQRIAVIAPEASQ
jgi:hypothetical protein